MKKSILATLMILPIAGFTLQNYVPAATAIGAPAALPADGTIQTLAVGDKKWPLIARGLDDRLTDLGLIQNADGTARFLLPVTASFPLRDQFAFALSALSKGAPIHAQSGMLFTKTTQVRQKTSVIVLEGASTDWVNANVGYDPGTAEITVPYRVEIVTALTKAGYQAGTNFERQRRADGDLLILKGKPDLEA